MWAAAACALAWIVACSSEGGTIGTTFVPEPRDGASPDGGGVTDASFLDAVEPPVNPPCERHTCADQGIECGAAGDGCGGIIPDCGQCASDLHCGGPASPSKCVSPNVGSCFPRCVEQGIECGPAFDSCGFLVTSCGTCEAGTQCGGFTTHSKCVAPETCTPKTCAEADASCGQAPNGCGGLTASCGTCEDNFVCRGGTCVQACMPRTCTEAGAQCGYTADGCGGLIDCGVCPAPFTCGYGGQANKCGRKEP